MPPSETKPCEKVLSREALRALCQPLFEQVIDAVEQVQDLAKKGDHTATNDELAALSCAIQQRFGGIRQQVDDVADALQARNNTCSPDESAPSGTEKLQHTSLSASLTAALSNELKEEDGTEPSTDIDSGAEECSDFSSQTSATERADHGYQADSDETSRHRALGTRLEDKAAKRKLRRGLHVPFGLPGSSVRCGRGMSDSECSAMSRDPSPVEIGNWHRVVAMPSRAMRTSAESRWWRDIDDEECQPVTVKHEADKPIKLKEEMLFDDEPGLSSHLESLMSMIRGA